MLFRSTGRNLSMLAMKKASSFPIANDQSLHMESAEVNMLTIYPLVCQLVQKQRPASDPYAALSNSW